MKNPGKAQKLELPYAPEAEALLDELERSGQFRVGLDAELDDDVIESTASNAYSWGRGSGSVSIQDWWTSGSVALRVGPGIGKGDVVLARIDDSLLLRTNDGLDRVALEGYLGLIPDASTLRIIFSDGSEMSGKQLVARISSRVISADLPPDAPA
jgi:hypothetical protein